MMTTLPEQEPDEETVALPMRTPVPAADLERRIAAEIECFDWLNTTLRDRHDFNALQINAVQEAMAYAGLELSFNSAVDSEPHLNWTEIKRRISLYYDADPACDERFAEAECQCKGGDECLLCLAWGDTDARYDRALKLVHNHHESQFPGHGCLQLADAPETAVELAAEFCRLLNVPLRTIIEN